MVPSVMFAAALLSLSPQVTILHEFVGNGDGILPEAGLVSDRSGALYGTTAVAGATDHGIVFRLTPKRTGYSETILYNFKGKPDGFYPIARLAMDSAGNLFGTTWLGGLSPKPCNHDGCGTVFELLRSSGYTERVLYRFTAGTDGYEPTSGLLSDGTGSWYGTSSQGGAYNCGVVYKLTLSGSHVKESVIFTFPGQSGGCYPQGDLISDRSGALYGTTSGGGNPNGHDGYGTVFKLTPSKAGFQEQVIYAFNGADGYGPAAGLVMDPSGALFGTTQFGGTIACPDLPPSTPAGCGNVFKLAPAGTSYVESVLYAFQGVVTHAGNKGDGAFPEAAPTLDAKRNIYGTTLEGGYMECLFGCGIVFELKATPGGYREKILHLFAGPNYEDGAYPIGGLLAAPSGRFFGTTSQGGSPNVQGGTAFLLTL
ncbi:MAG: hypothetical protein JO043_01915 [Candidatus Eremiobacteraeota bacterium]|nr:hypothetical protein [Candidatus Eremiobacteraeota bacterium]